MLVNDPAGCRRIGGVSGYRGERFAQFVAQLIELRAGAGDAYDVRTGGRQRHGDGAAESAAGTGNDRRRTG
jgi:hypothetical protein